MDYQIPYTNRLADVTKLLDWLTAQPAPGGEEESGIIKKWGFSPVSDMQKYLLNNNAKE
jgi:hypothetical protein